MGQYKGGKGAIVIESGEWEKTSGPRGLARRRGRDLEEPGPPHRAGLGPEHAGLAEFV